MAESTSAVKPKRKRTVLSIEDKVAIIKQLESSSANVIAERYGIVFVQCYRMLYNH